jgi:hypothetical protein
MPLVHDVVCVAGLDQFLVDGTRFGQSNQAVRLRSEFLELARHPCTVVRRLTTKRPACHETSFLVSVSLGVYLQERLSISRRLRRSNPAPSIV